MITAPGRIRSGIALRALAFLLAVGVIVLPSLPQPRLHLCHMMGTMLEHCCCSAQHVQASPALPAPDAAMPSAPGKGPCCLQVAVDQHQPFAPAGIEAVALPSETIRTLVQVLAMPVRHRERYGGAACAAPYPDGPPRYVRWGAFLT